MGQKEKIWLIYFLTILEIYVRADEYRLPKSVIPINYNILIKLEADAFSTNIFHGEVNITLKVLEPTQQIQLHTTDLHILSLNLSHLDGALNIANHTHNNVTDILTIVTDQLSPDTYFLTISYNSTLSLYDMHGFYKSSYQNEQGITEFLAATQFELTHARRAFPCFDEPSFKATFNLSIVYPKGYNVIANTLPRNFIETSDELQTVHFEPTPRMSTYLNAFVISNFTCDGTSGPLPFRVCSRAEASNERKYALEISPKLLKILEDFSGIPYSVSGLGKMDQVAIPDFSAGAMENWGLVTYRETALLWNSNESSNFYKQRVASVIAHEFAHMWFGNLVTLEWWSDVFLNEGFARYFQYFATAQVEPSWELEKQFVIEQVHTAFVDDSSESAIALSTNLTTPEEINNHFGTISYNKGASVIKMIMHVMGLELFQHGIQQYLQINKFNNTTPQDLLSCLKNVSLLPLEMQDFPENWIYQPGYPVLNVRLNGTNVIITQERFLLRGANDTKWYVPITYTTSSDHEKFTSTATQNWLTPNHTELVLERKIVNDSDWIILNNQQIGYYRVNYDQNLRKRIYNVLTKTPHEIHVINRAQIVDDLFNFAKANKTSFTEVLDMISFLNEETEYYPWYSAFRGFTYTLQKINNQEIKSELTNYILQLMNKLYASVSVSSVYFHDQIYSLKQAMAFDWACKLENADCINHSKHIFSNFKNGVNPNKNLKHTVYCTALRHSNNTEEDWNFLWNKYKSAKISTEQVTVLQSLGCTTNEEILRRYLNYAINSSSLIRRQDTALVFASVINGHTDGFNVAFRFFTQNYTQIVDHYKDDKSVTSLLKNIVNMFTHQDQVDELDRFIHSGILNNKTKNAAETISKNAKENLQWRKTVEDQLTTYFKKQESSASTNKGQCFVYLITLIISTVFLH